MGNSGKIREAFKEVLPLVFERESVVKLDKVLAEVMNQHLGEFSLADIRKEVGNISELRNLGGLSENPWMSPEEVIGRELYAVKSVEEQKMYSMRSHRIFRRFQEWSQESNRRSWFMGC